MANKIIPTAAGVMALPDYMRGLSAEEQRRGTELLEQYVVPPRIKVVQKASRKPFSELFRPGDLVSVPSMQLIAKFEESRDKPAFTFVPVFFWPEWCTWNPLETRGSLPVIRDRSLDQKSVIAVKARDPQKRQSEICPERQTGQDGKPLYLRHVEHLNYMIWVLDGPLADSLICLSFSRGEHNAGSRFNSVIMARKAPLYGCVFQAVPRERPDRGKGEWHGVDGENPSAPGTSPWAPKELFESLKLAHDKFEKDYTEKKLRVDYDDLDEEVGTAKDTKEF